MISAIRQDPGETLSFEEALQKIREIASALENGDLTLEESLNTYQEGAHLIEQCRETISKAEIRITELTKDSEDDG